MTKEQAMLKEKDKQIDLMAEFIEDELTVDEFCTKEGCYADNYIDGHFNTIIIQKQTIDYCDRTKCKNKMQQVIMCWKRIQKYECLLYEKRLKEREKEFINKIVGGKTNGKTI